MNLKSMVKELLFLVFNNHFITCFIMAVLEELGELERLARMVREIASEDLSKKQLPMHVPSWKTAWRKAAKANAASTTSVSLTNCRQRRSEDLPAEPPHSSGKLTSLPDPSASLIRPRWSASFTSSFKSHVMDGGLRSQETLQAIVASLHDSLDHNPAGGPLIKEFYRVHSKV